MKWMGLQLRWKTRFKMLFDVDLVDMRDWVSDGVYGGGAV
jgi:hypothetical protein